ncbi:MAG TPA: hypothetical protein VKS79_13130 [Gemmataceae bacterium]|nr:hypothetical protein [Gemmataceae bacterium]
MTVGDLKQHLADLAKLLDASGGKQVAKDFAIMADGLAPFAAQSPAEFARFLAVAHEYHTTGKLTAPEKAPRAAKPRQPKADAGELATAIRQLYDQASDLSLPMERVDSELAKLAPLTKDGLLTVCEAMELFGMKSKKKDEIAAAIRQKVLDRRSAAQRAAMIQNPPGAQG